MEWGLMAPITDRTTRIASPITTKFAAKGSVFVDLRNAGNLKIVWNWWVEPCMVRFTEKRHSVLAHCLTVLEPFGTVPDSRTTTQRKCEAVPRRARI